MRWLLAGYCVLVNLSVTLTVMVIQMPRFYGVKAGRNVFFKCITQSSTEPAKVMWYKTLNFNNDTGKRVALNIYGSNNAILVLNGVTVEDTGVYYCMINKTWGPGSALQVSRAVNRENAVYRSKMKDGIMILQGLLLALFVAALLQNKRTITKKLDSEYEEPETNHIYEGLTIETCGGGLYEELSIYAQAEGAEAPWE